MVHIVLLDGMEVKTTDEYDAWFLEQVEDGQASIRMKIGLLEEYGLLLPRPHADTLIRKRVE